MGYFNRNNIKNEFLNFLRNSDIFSTTIRGVTTDTDSGTTSETGAETITLANTGVKNIRAVTYDGDSISLGTDYTIDIDNNQITFLSVVPDKAYTVQYDYGSGDKIYPDYPRTDLVISSYPRLGFDIYGQTTESGGFGNVNVTSFRFDVNLYATSRKSAEGYIDTLRSKIIDAQTDLYYISYMKPINVRTIEPIDIRGKNKVYMIGFDIESRNNYEIN
jgi:hypothetical protein